jgi:hypothetical protein
MVFQLPFRSSASFDLVRCLTGRSGHEPPYDGLPVPFRKREETGHDQGLLLAG